MRHTLRAFAVLSLGVLGSLTLLAPQSALADPFPPGAQAQNVKQIGFSALGGRYGAFKIAIKHTADDKWYLYTGHSFNQGWSIVDVTDPANPRYVKFIPLRHRRQEHHHGAGDAARQSDDHLAQQLRAAEEPVAGGAAVGHFRSGKSQAGRLVDGRRHRRAPQFLSGRQIRLSLDQLSGLQGPHPGDPRRQRSGQPEGSRQMVAARPEGRRAGVALPGRLSRAGQCQPRRQNGVAAAIRRTWSIST